MRYKNSRGCRRNSFAPGRLHKLSSHGLSSGRPQKRMPVVRSESLRQQRPTKRGVCAFINISLNLCSFWCNWWFANLLNNLYNPVYNVVVQSVFYFPLKSKLKALLHLPQYASMLQHEFVREKNDDYMADVYDTPAWKSFMGPSCMPNDRIGKIII